MVEYSLLGDFFFSGEEDCISAKRLSMFSLNFCVVCDFENVSDVLMLMTLSQCHNSLQC
jgi:hypothetical protein